MGWLGWLVGEGYIRSSIRCWCLYDMLWGGFKLFFRFFVVFLFFLVLRESFSYEWARRFLILIFYASFGIEDVLC